MKIRSLLSAFAIAGALSVAAVLARPPDSFVESSTAFVNRHGAAFRTVSETTALFTSAADGDPLSLDPSETALVLIEYQNEFATEGGALYEAVKPCLEKYGTIPNSKKVAEKARAVGCTIIHVPIAFEEGHKEISNAPYGILAAIKKGKTFRTNEWGSQFCDDMRPSASDLICKGKSGLCGFHSTNLDFLLRQNGIQNVVLGGFLTNCCVESTMRAAYERGYKVFTLKDCCAATSIKGQEAAFEYTFGMFSVPTTSDDVIAAVTKDAGPTGGSTMSYLDTL